MCSPTYNCMIQLELIFGGKLFSTPLIAIKNIEKKLKIESINKNSSKFKFIKRNPFRILNRNMC